MDNFLSQSHGIFLRKSAKHVKLIFKSMEEDPLSHSPRL